MRPESIRAPLREWYRANGRDLPWRRTQDPYAIWVSETMLQQTRVTTVIPYFERWMTAFPTVGALAKADETMVLTHWQGLGYYRRCWLLMEGARTVVANGRMPESAKEWREIPGVGPYTANAIASITLGEPVPVVDGNVERVYARLSGSSSSGAELHREAWSWAHSVLDHEDPGTWNQAVMELGATVCAPKTPRCIACPVRGSCIARTLGITDRLPNRPAKPTPVRREMHLVVPVWSTQVGVRRIEEGAWWTGLWTCPLFDTPEEVTHYANEQKLLDWPRRLPSILHTVTHHRVTLAPWLVRLDQPISDLRWVAGDKLAEIPIPRPHRRAIERALAELGLRSTESL